jgi:hypothetical protein
MRTDNRLHALDAVRAFALLIGIVLHATMTFMPGLAAIGFPADSSQSPTLQTVFYVIHIFRMSLFFFIAGYFAHLAFHRKGAMGFLRDRGRRILIPLVAGWLVFGPVAMALVYVAFGPSVEGAAAPAFGGFPLSHLWFLYYLVVLYVTTLGGRACFMKSFDRPAKLVSFVDARVRAVMQGYAAPILLAAPLAACLYFTPNWIMWSGIATPDTGLTPRLSPMIGFGTAFVFGWLLHRQVELLSVVKQRWAMHLGLAAALTIASLFLVERAPNPFDVEPAIKFAYAACYTVAIWNWIFGIIGCAMKFFSGESAVRRYLADASYWMYLAHLPLVFALQMIVLKWPLHWSIKFPMIVTVAITLLLLSYHYLVRNTYIGQILNGRRYPGSVASPRANHAAQQNVTRVELAGSIER